MAVKLRAICLPTYSPDLDPIESGRILIKRELAILLLDFNIMAEKSKEKVLLLLELSKERKNRYTNYW